MLSSDITKEESCIKVIYQFEGRCGSQLAGETASHGMFVEFEWLVN